MSFDRGFTRFLRFRHKVTGEDIDILQGRAAHFRNACHKLTQFVRYNFSKPYVYHLTLTVAENVSSIDMSHYNRTMTFIRTKIKRAGGDVKYIGVKEWQDRGAIHFHVLFVVDRPYLFPDVNDITCVWSLGFCKVTFPKVRISLEKIMGYIGKYMGKGFEYGESGERKSFSASQIGSIYKLSQKKMLNALKYYTLEILKGCKCSYRYVWREHGYKKREYLIKFESDWEFMGVIDVPF